MKWTLRERILSKLVRKGKKSRLLYIMVVPLIFLILLFGHLYDGTISNLKKYACVVTALLFFVMSSSFSFPIFEEMELSQPTMTFIADNQVALSVDHKLSEEPDVKVLDDNDVLDGYEDTELDNINNVDKYTLDEILEENESEAVKNADSADEKVDLNHVVFDKDDWRLVLINKQHPIPDDYSFTLGNIKGSMKCDERIIGDLVSMLQGAKKDGINLVICSPYRDLSRQQILFNRKIKAYMSQNMSYMEAYKVSSQTVTVPGASEHQIGLALDIVADNYASLNAGFGDTAAGKWLQEHSCDYGFILRYPAGKEFITSIEYEPWHFRYVGKEAATYMKEKDICLEEFVENL